MEYNLLNDEFAPLNCKSERLSLIKVVLAILILIDLSGHLWNSTFSFNDVSRLSENIIFQR